MSSRPRFLLSPAYCGGRRARMLTRPGSTIGLAERLREGGLSLGEAFAFMSGLYFRGKLAYARAFTEPDSMFVITPTRGLIAPDAAVTTAMIEEFAAVDVEAGDARYREPLERDLASLRSRLVDGTPVILLGSIATGKYVDVLTSILGPALYYPSSFVGRGDMSRGGLMLRSAAAGVELEYTQLDPGISRRGPRPPKLEPIKVPAGQSVQTT
jgi:hypothetical protein